MATVSRETQVDRPWGEVMGRNSPPPGRSFLRKWRSPRADPSTFCRCTNGRSEAVYYSCPTWKAKPCGTGSTGDPAAVRPLKIAGKVSEGWLCAEYGIIHRYIKPPTSVGLPRDGGRFRHCRAISHGDGVVTQTGLAVGSRTYMGPSRRRGPRGDARADIYAVEPCSTRYRGEPPSRAHAARIVTRSMRNAPLLRLPQTCADVDRVAMKALAKSPRPYPTDGHW